MIPTISSTHGGQITEMPLHLYLNVHASGSVPQDWEPSKGDTVKYAVHNPVVRCYLRQLLTGSWQKVIKKGTTGEVHYFEHSSGQVAGVKFFPRKDMS
ncbi:MAG: hypothetical protein AB1634_01755 [Thermodesulfobacteriota bacterium]